MRSVDLTHDWYFLHHRQLFLETWAAALLQLQRLLLSREEILCFAASRLYFSARNQFSGAVFLGPALGERKLWR